MCCVKAAADAALRAAQDITAAVAAEFGEDRAEPVDDVADTDTAVRKVLRQPASVLCPVLAPARHSADDQVIFCSTRSSVGHSRHAHTLTGSLGFQEVPAFEEKYPKKPRRGDVMGALRAGMDKLAAATQSTLQSIGSTNATQRFWVCLQVRAHAFFMSTVINMTRG